MLSQIEASALRCTTIYMVLMDDFVRTILYYTGPKTTIICCHEIRDEISRSDHSFLRVLNQITNDAFVKKLSESCKVKKVAKSKMHPDYSNNYIEIINAKLNRGSKA